MQAAGGSGAAQIQSPFGAPSLHAQQQPLIVSAARGSDCEVGGGIGGADGDLDPPSSSSPPAACAGGRIDDERRENGYLFFLIFLISLATQMPLSALCASVRASPRRRRRHQSTRVVERRRSDWASSRLRGRHPPPPPACRPQVSTISADYSAFVYELVVGLLFISALPIALLQVCVCGRPPHLTAHSGVSTPPHTRSAPAAPGLPPSHASPSRRAIHTSK